MKTLTFAICLSIAITTFSGVAMAVNEWGSGTPKISQIEVSDTTGSGTTSNYLTFDALPITTNCSAGSTGQWLVSGGNATVIKDIVTQATAAKLAGRQVKVFWSGCTGGGTTGYPTLSGLSIL